MTDEAKLVIVLEAQSKKMQNQLVQVSKQIDRFAAQTERRFATMQKTTAASFDRLGSRLKGSMAGLNSVLGPLVGAVGIREVINYADAWTEAGNKIAAAAQTSGQLARPLDQIKDAANGARSELTTYVDLYARLLRISPAIAASEADVARATDLVAKSLKAGGASASEQSAALTQLGQALGSGVLQGDELRSLRENAPLVAKAIADEFGVSIGELKKLGAEGKLTSDRVFKAILHSAKDIEKAFDSTQATIGDAFSRIGNELTAYIGTAGQANGATQGLVSALNFLAENFTEVADVVIQFATLIAGALAGKAIAGFVVSIGEAIAALGAFLAAMRTGTLVAAGFTAALGPIGLLAGLAAAAIFLMSQSHDAAQVAADKHTKQVKGNADALKLAAGASREYIKSLRDQIEMQTSAAKAALAESDAQLTAATAKAAASRFNLMGMKVSNPFDEQALSDQIAKSYELEKTFNTLVQQLHDADALLSGSKPGGGGGGGADGDQEKFQKALDAAKARTKDLMAETAAQAALNPLVNDYGFALERARITQDLLNAAEAAHVEITPKVRAAIDVVALGYAQATAEAARLTEAQDKALESMRGWFDLGRDALKGFISDLASGKSAAEALGGVFDKLANKFLDMGLDVLFGTGGKDFGILGKIFGFADGGIAANGRPQPLPRFANGGVSRTASIFGEAGPEAAVPLPDGRRIPVDLRGPTNGSAGGGIAVSVSVGVENGELVPLIAQVSGEVSGRQIEQRTPQIVKRVAPGAVRIAQRDRTY